MDIKNIGVMAFLVTIVILFFGLIAYAFLIMLNKDPAGIFLCNKYCNKSYSWQSQSKSENDEILSPLDTIYLCEDSTLGIGRVKSYGQNGWITQENTYHCLPGGID